MNNPKFIKLTWDEYQLLRDFVFNCCEVQKSKYHYVKWETNRVNFLADLCHEIDANINASKVAQERVIF